MRLAVPFILLTACTLTRAQSPDWTKINPELLSHCQAVLRFDTTDPPGNETRVAEYIKKVFDAEGIPVTIAAKDPPAPT